MKRSRLTKELFDQIVAVLLPEMGDSNTRKATIESALYGSLALQNIQWDGPLKVYAAHHKDRIWRELGGSKQFDLFCKRASGVSCGAVRGAAIKMLRGLSIVTSTIRPIAAALSVFGWLVSCVPLLRFF
jgi:hypothetical protein